LLLLPPLLLFTQELQAKSCHGNDCFCFCSYDQSKNSYDQTKNYDDQSKNSYDQTKNSDDQSKNSYDQTKNSYFNKKGPN